jgi:hypothetical protein
MEGDSTAAFDRDTSVRAKRPSVTGERDECPIFAGLGFGRDGGCRVADETERARLISEITQLLREPLIPEATRTAGLTLIGWLARRMPGEAPHAIGVPEARRESERLLKTAARKAR